MSDCNWTIIWDHITSDIPEAVNIIGPSNSTLRPVDIITKGVKFQLLDDDRNLYYEGYICGDYSGFEPLDDFGMPNAGCTIIQYYKNGKWEDL